MSIINPQEGGMQFGFDVSYKNPGPMQVKLPVISESYDTDYLLKTSEAMIGNKVSGKMESMGRKVAGGFKLMATPDIIGYIVGAAFGFENNVNSQPDFEEHELVPVPAGTNNSLKSYSLCIDRIIDQDNPGTTTKVLIVSAKINSMKFTAQPEDYLYLEIDAPAYDEIIESTQWDDALLLSTLKFLKYSNGELKLTAPSINGGVEQVFADIESITMNYANNLTDKKQGLDGDPGPRENQPQMREITFDLTVDLSSDIALLKHNEFKNATDIALKLKFISPDLITKGAGTEPFSIEFDCPNCQFTKVPLNLNQDMKTVSLSLKAHEAPGTEAIYARIRDNQVAKYIE